MFKFLLRDVAIVGVRLRVCVCVERDDLHPAGCWPRLRPGGGAQVRSQRNIRSPGRRSQGNKTLLRAAGSISSLNNVPEITGCTAGSWKTGYPLG